MTIRRMVLQAKRNNLNVRSAVILSPDEIGDEGSQPIYEGNSSSTSGGLGITDNLKKGLSQ